MKFARNIFLAAGIYGMIILTPMYFMEDRISRELPPAVTHPEYFYGFLGVGLAWQILFVLVARNPVQYRLMMIPAVLEKVSYGMALVLLYAWHRIPFAVLALGSVDWILAFLFGVAYIVTGRNTDDLQEVS
ncbi:MAG: hypothetical protein U0V70_07660 [Terriglobia bacterium]